MADTIKEFVAKLQQEGVQAGQAAAEELQVTARKQAEKTLADAQAEGKKTIADAQAEAQAILARGKTELELAARDSIGKLREALDAAMKGILTHAAQKNLSDVDFLGKTLHEIILLHAKADLEKKNTLHLNVSEEMYEKLKEWALAELAQGHIEKSHSSIDLKGRLKQAGFEYEADGGTVEVTLDSVVELLRELVSPALRDVLADARKEL